MAEARITRHTASGVHPSLLSASGAAGLQSVGLDPVGEVMGCVVKNVGWRGFSGCGYVGGTTNPWGGQSTTASSPSSMWSSYRPYAEAVRRGYRTALERLLREATSLGADGVVGIRLTADDFHGTREFLALGTAVRARSSVRPARPFTTDLHGSDVTKLMQAGWVPASLVVSFEVAVRHDDWHTANQAGSWSNTEVSGYTDLVQRVRHGVRRAAEAEGRRLGADGFVTSAIDLHVHGIEAGERHHDHVAEALMIGTAIAAVHRPRRLGASDSTAPHVSVQPVSVLPLAHVAEKGNRR